MRENAHFGRWLVCMQVHAISYLLHLLMTRFTFYICMTVDKSFFRRREGELTLGERSKPCYRLSLVLPLSRLIECCLSHLPGLQECLRAVFGLRQVNWISNNTLTHVTGILNYRDRTEIKIVSLEIQSFPLSSEANTIAIIKKIPLSRIYLFTYERCDILRVPDTTVSTNVARQTITFRLHIKVADSTEYGQI